MQYFVTGATGYVGTRVVPRLLDAGWTPPGGAQCRVWDERPAPACDDTTFIRRAMFDLIGRQPTAAEITAFVLDPAAGTGGFLVCALEHIRSNYVKGDADRRVRSTRRSAATPAALNTHRVPVVGHIQVIVRQRHIPCFRTTRATHRCTCAHA